MTLPLLFLALGIVLGKLVLPDSMVTYADQVVSWSLWVVIFTAGIDAGSKKIIFAKLREYKAKVLLIPLGTVIGSLAGGALVGLALGMPLNQSLAVSAGLGYYSMAAGLLTEAGGADLGALAFTTNILRELIAISTVPVFVKFLGNRAAIAPAGATSMDTALGVIARATDEETTVIAMINGVVLSALVPVIVPVLFRLAA